MLVTGALLLCYGRFPDPLGWLALAADVASLLFFLGQIFRLPLLSFATGLAGSALVGPIFWIGLTTALWRRRGQAPEPSS